MQTNRVIIHARFASMAARKNPRIVTVTYVRGGATYSHIFPWLGITNMNPQIIPAGIAPSQVKSAEVRQ